MKENRALIFAKASIEGKFIKQMIKIMENWSKRRKRFKNAKLNEENFMNNVDS